MDHGILADNQEPTRYGLMDMNNLYRNKLFTFREGGICHVSGYDSTLSLALVFLVS